MEPYLFMALFGLLFVVLSHSLARIKPNSALGFKLPAAYASPEIWKMTNQKGAQIMYIFGPALSTASILLYSTSVPVETGMLYLAFGSAAVLLATCVYLYFYSDKLFRKTFLQSGATTVSTIENTDTSKVNVILLFIMSISLVVVGILEIYSHAGASIGIQVGNTFRDAATWHKVNAVGGIGNIVIGAFFTLYFTRFISGVKNPRAFYRAVFSFVAAGILWTIVSTIYAYHV